MAPRKSKSDETTEDLLRNLSNLIQDQTIVQLGLAGVPQRQIREIMGVDITRVNKIVKHLKKTGG